MAICSKTTVSYDELVLICRARTKLRSNVGRRGEMVCEVARCLTVNTLVHHDTDLVSDSLVRPVIEIHRGGVT